ncbi:hypothetical protein [Spirosoma jeollabukense]
MAVTQALGLDFEKQFSQYPIWRSTELVGLVDHPFYDGLGAFYMVGEV